jgi:hypothetical protein
MERGRVGAWGIAPRPGENRKIATHHPTRKSPDHPAASKKLALFDTIAKLHKSKAHNIGVNLDKYNGLNTRCTL